ncbi:hypothetical protein SAMN05444354_102190 [Stigmatella aurantiaca]|uniref:Uncharacterized protein n=1 Tax=Stigmatella aurantiaca TaxID=41 RepID=A0A1H7JES6_STIAU|nr:hypothetical protein [Stigmatella aurantiaca]SEK73118.1 hypothetical protein SAMN05444354_102190 [Stigmatella aurantiaca]
MSAQHPAPERRVDSDGVVRIEHRRSSGASWVLRLGLVLTCLCLALSAWLVFDRPAVESLPVFAQEEPPPPPPASPAPPVRTVRPAARPAVPKHLEAEIAAIPEEVLEQIPEGVFEMPKPGEAPTGLMLFPAPGTDPLKTGILVPEDFELPPGYVRHYQATDDGERVPAILMFSPDGPPLDANGQPMQVTANGIVPPELAPPGMPIQLLEVPKSGGGTEEPEP